MEATSEITTESGIVSPLRNNVNSNSNNNISNYSNSYINSNNDTYNNSNTSMTSVESLETTELQLKEVLKNEIQIIKTFFINTGIQSLTSQSVAEKLVKDERIGSIDRLQFLKQNDLVEVLTRCQMPEPDIQFLLYRLGSNSTTYVPLRTPQMTPDLEGVFSSNSNSSGINSHNSFNSLNNHGNVNNFTSLVYSNSERTLVDSNIFNPFAPTQRDIPKRDWYLANPGYNSSSIFHSGSQAGMLIVTIAMYKKTVTVTSEINYDNNNDSTLVVVVMTPTM